jgi:hypothetical protein
LQQIGRGAGRAYFFGCDSSGASFPPWLCWNGQCVCPSTLLPTGRGTPFYVSSTFSPTGIHAPSRSVSGLARQNARSLSPATASLRWARRASWTQDHKGACNPPDFFQCHPFPGWYPMGFLLSISSAKHRSASQREPPSRRFLPELPSSHRQGRTLGSWPFGCLGLSTAAWTPHWPRSLTYASMRSLANTASRRRHGHFEIQVGMADDMWCCELFVIPSCQEPSTTSSLEPVHLHVPDLRYPTPYEKNTGVFRATPPSLCKCCPTHAEANGRWPESGRERGGGVVLATQNSSLVESTTMSLSRSSRTQSRPLPATMALAVPFIIFHR